MLLESMIEIKYSKEKLFSVNNFIVFDHKTFDFSLVNLYCFSDKFLKNERNTLEKKA